MLLGVLVELHLDQVLNHLIKDGCCVIRSRHLPGAIGHVCEHLSQVLEHLLLLIILIEVLLAVLDHGLDLLHQNVLQRDVSRLFRGGLCFLELVALPWIRLRLGLAHQALRWVRLARTRRLAEVRAL